MLTARTPLDPDWPDHRRYVEDTNDDAHPEHPCVACPQSGRLEEAWLARDTSYIWRVGILTQVDANKADHVTIFIAHEREPGWLQYIGCLHWEGGENDDLGRSLTRYLELARRASPGLFDR